MKIKKEIVHQAFIRLTKQTTNKFWGLLTIFSTIDKTIKLIDRGETYKVDTLILSKKLQDLFYFGTPKQFNKNLLYVRLSNFWIESLLEQVVKRKPQILDVAIFFYKDYNFEKPITNYELIEKLISEIRISKLARESIFNQNSEYKIEFEANYEKKIIFDLIKTSKKHLTLTFEHPFSIASHPSELQRAPFIQTLYSGTKIQELILLTKFDFDAQYLNNIAFFSTKTQETQPTNQIYYGSPGVGKSYIVKQKLKDIPEFQKERVTFHPDYDYASFIGGYMPISEGDQIRYKFVPQVFINIYVKAWQDLTKDFYLIIEEINRGNCAEIFGDIFQLLDREGAYPITPMLELQKHLIQTLGGITEGIKHGKMILPPNLHLIATMNTSDQSLFPMDSAFKRRWTWKYISINYNRNATENPSAAFYVELDDKKSFSWLDFLEKVNLDYIKNNEVLGADKCIGNYFIKPMANEITLEEFINKAIFYLWNDVFRDEEETPFPNGISYEDFFPETDNGKTIVETMLETLDVKVESIETLKATDENID